MEAPRVGTDGAWVLQFLWLEVQQTPPGSDAWGGGWRSLPPVLLPVLRELAEAGFIDLREPGDAGSLFPSACLRREEFEAAFGPGPYHWR